MNRQLCIFMLIIFVFPTYFVVTSYPSAQSTDYYDAFVLEKIDPAQLNTRLVKFYVNCLLDDGKCPADARRLKKIVPEAVTTDCARCSPRQKNFVDKMIKILQVQYPKKYCRLARKYDLNTQYRHKNELTNGDDSSCV